ncbi:hypothetical protein FS749_005628 [Ceratobasidium sp. UAMH 11750]|nr:hypothetical protein FS749_005628 [Ceratobasidium sp. UAMH 11750]
MYPDGSMKDPSNLDGHAELLKYLEDVKAWKQGFRRLTESAWDKEKAKHQALVEAGTVALRTRETTGPTESTKKRARPNAASSSAAPSSGPAMRLSSPEQLPASTVDSSSSGLTTPSNIPEPNAPGPNTPLHITAAPPSNTFNNIHGQPMSATGTPGNNYPDFGPYSGFPTIPMGNNDLPLFAATSTFLPGASSNEYLGMSDAYNEYPTMLAPMDDDNLAPTTPMLVPTTPRRVAVPGYVPSLSNVGYWDQFSTHDSPPIPHKFRVNIASSSRNVPAYNGYSSPTIFPLHPVVLSSPASSAPSSPRSGSTPCCRRDTFQLNTPELMAARLDSPQHRWNSRLTQPVTPSVGNSVPVPPVMQSLPNNT